MFQLKLQFLPQSNATDLEILSAFVNQYEVDGVQELEDGLLVYVDESFDKNQDFQKDLKSWITTFSLTIEKKELPNINWNNEWESNFQPVFVDDFLTIKADFHQIEKESEFTITINPKMSFGTGHHATTWMMTKMMSKFSFQDKKVLDAGSGTGILAILAEFLGAKEIVAFDNDKWCYDNALENVEINNCHNIQVIDGSIEEVKTTNFDIVLANINRNFMLSNGHLLVNKMNSDSLLVVSGFLLQDIKQILSYFDNIKLVAQYLITQQEWSCVIFKKV